MKARKIVVMAAALLMCLSLAACYQQTDVMDGVEPNGNVLTTNPNYAAPAQQEPEEEAETPGQKAPASEAPAPETSAGAVDPDVETRQPPKRQKMKS